ncbi:MAG: NAD(+)/NADH kinase [Deltaproteobacteria bacterium]|nr:NAD(+)/NADH kinase [Deltaproteobacteria bacterium]
MLGGSGLKRVAVVAKPGSREATRVAGELAEWLVRRELQVSLDETTLRAVGTKAMEAYDPAGRYGLVVALGGDGTLLSVARGRVGAVPLLGVNLGNLGFLTEVRRSELYPTMVSILAGNYTLEERSLLQVDIYRQAGSQTSFRAFNDAVIAKGTRSRIIDLNLTVDSRLVARYRADGLIVSTPTGSTAYNLSANGPILHPLLPVTVITPICPHTLSIRPLAVPDSSSIEVILETKREEVHLTVDGQEGTTIRYRDRIRVTRHANRVLLVKAHDRSFYDSLREKLRWGGLGTPGEPTP